MTAPLPDRFHIVDAGDLPVYPLTEDDRLDSHFFMPWERRRWLNSDMRLKGTPECRALYFDLICISCDQSPIGTLPDDIEILAKLLHVETSHLRALAKLEFGPLHNWQRCLCDDEVRLFHSFVLRILRDSIARREDNRARCEAANTAKRLQRLRETIAGYHVDLAKNDAAIRWMDQWLLDSGCRYRGGQWIERAIGEWSNHALSLRGRA